MDPRRIVLVVLAAAALAGCENVTGFFQTLGVLQPDYRPRVGTGAIHGVVVDRSGNRLVGAQVTNGQAAFYSAYKGVPLVDDLYNFGYASTDPQNKSHTLALEQGEFYLTRVASGVTYVRATYDGQESAAYQLYVTAGTFDITKPVVVNSVRSYQGATEIGEIKIPVDGPVGATQSTAIEATGNNLGGETIKAASSSTSPKSLSYEPNNGVVGIWLKAPPGSKGIAIDRARITYYAASYDPSAGGNPLSNGTNASGVGTNPIMRSFPSVVTVLPGTALQSGPLTLASVNVISSSPAFQAYLTTNGEVKAKIELLASGIPSSATESLVINRSGVPIQAVVSIQYRP